MWKFDTCKASWLESFDLLKSDAMQLLLLVSFKTLFSVYRSLLRAWFLPFTLLAGLVLTIPRLLCAFYTTFLIRASRPSIDWKNATYWQKTVVADWVLFIAALAIVYFPLLWKQLDFTPLVSDTVFYGYDVLARALFLAPYLWLPGTEPLGTLILFLSPFIIIWALFLLDARLGFWSSIQAFGRALLMIIYNYPFFLVTYLLMRILISSVYVIFSPFTILPYLPLFAWIGLLAFFVPYWICLMTNFYSRRLHEQFNLYY